MLGRIARSLLALVGALALTAGVAGVLYVGPDDDLLLPPARPGAEPGQLVVTAPDLLSYDDLTLVVRARADGGVLLAAGNPVDITSLADQVGHWEVTGVRLGGVTGGRRLVAADHPTLLGDLAELPAADVWTAHAEGEGWQELRLGLDGHSVQVLAQPRDGEVPELQVGAHVGGLFWLLVGIAAGGGALLGTAVTLMVRARRRRGPRRTAALLLPALALALVAAGCGVPHAVSSEPPSRIALDQDDLPAMLAAYDERNNRAIRAAHAPRYATGPWRAVDTGPILEDDLYDTIVSRRAHERERPETFTHTPVRVYSPRHTSYPMWSLVVIGDEDAAEVDVFTRATAASPWLMRTSSGADLDDLPEARDAGEVEAADPEAVVAARDAVAATTRYVATGILRGVQLTHSTREMHRWATQVSGDDQKYIHSQQATVDSAAAEPQDDLRVVSVQGGHLAVAVRPMRVTSYPRDRLEVSWKPAVSTVNGRFGQSLYRDFNLCLVVFVPSDGGTPRAVAASALPARA